MRPFALWTVALCCAGCGPSTDFQQTHLGHASSAVAPTLSPANVTLAQGQTQTFTPAGTGPYTWALQGGASGSITNAGVYTAGAPGQAGATDTVTVTDTGAGNATGTATVTISKGVNGLSNYGGSGLSAGNGFPIQDNTRATKKVGQTFQALAPTGGAAQGMVTFVAVDMVRTGGGSGQNIKAEIHSLTGAGGIDDQGASNAYASGTVDALTAIPSLNVKTKVLIPITPGTPLTMGTMYAVTLKPDVAGTLSAYVTVTSANDSSGGVTWWYAKRYRPGGWVSRGVYTSHPADYIKDTTRNISANVFITEVYAAPTTSSISPTSATQNGSGFTLTVNGTNFFAASTVNWGGAARTTTYMSPTQLTASILSGDITSVGTTSVTVTTPAPGGGTSGGQTFTVNSATNPVPSTSSISPTSASAGAGALTLTVNGTSFVSTSSVKWGGSARTTTYVSGTQLTAAITSGDLATASNVSVTVFNPTPGGGTSGAKTFQILGSDQTVSGNTSWSSNATYNNVTVNSASTLTVAGGITITVQGTLTVTGNSNVVVQSINNSAQVSSAWVGTGSTINANNVTVNAGSSINADYQGYTGVGGGGTGNGPGGGAGRGGSYDGPGGGYGGGGGTQSSTPGGTYDLALSTAPTNLGSAGGGATGNAGGNGGGAITLTVTGTLTLNGTISANGDPGGGYNGGGSGGSLYVTTGTLTGSGSFTANGGDRVGQSDANGSGGGGRVAVYYTTNSSFSGFTTSTAKGGQAASNGTIAFFDNSAGSGANSLYVYKAFAYPSSQTLSLKNIDVGATGATGATLTIGGGSTVTCSGTITVTQNSTMTLQSINNSALVSGTWQGSGVTLTAVNTTVNSGSKISANYQGYTGVGGGTGNGPGGGSGRGGSYDGPGGGYGGGGGTQTTTPGGTYDLTLASAPTNLGSAGGGATSDIGGSGGGAINLTVTGTLTLNGTISADGDPSGNYNGGGSGGSVYVTTGTLTGAGTFTANGGNRTGMSNANGSGGGGRVAVYYTTNSSFSGFATSTAKGGQSASDGTIAFFDNSVANNKLYVYKAFAYPASTTVNLNAVTVGPSGVTGATLTIGGQTTLNCTTLDVTNSSTLLVQSINNSALVSGTWQGLGGTINATGNVNIDSTSTISADGQGYTGVGGGGTGNGPGGGPGRGGGYDGPGGSYGGLGANGAGTAAATYDASLATAPTNLGSAGGGAAGETGPNGGGAIRLITTGTLTLNGTISANGGESGGYSGSGSGGSLYITTGPLGGSGTFRAKGGNTHVGGGGGRIAIYYTSLVGSSDTTTRSAAGGTGWGGGGTGSITFTTH